MKKTISIVLTVLTIFVTYFYIPSFKGITNKNVEKTFAADEYYKNISSCDGIDSISGFGPNDVPAEIGYGGLKMSDGGMKLNLTIKGQVYTFGYISSKIVDNFGDWLIYKNITESVETKLEFTSDHALIINKDGISITDVEISKLGYYGEFIKAMQDKSGSAGIQGNVNIPLDLERCQLFNPNKPIGNTSDQSKIIHMVSSSDTNLASKPKISIPASETRELVDDKATRPAMDLILSRVIYPEGSTGRVTFYFTYGGTETRFKNIGIKVFTDYSAVAVNFGDIEEPNDDSDTTSFFSTASYTEVIIDKADIKATLFSFAFNQKKEDGTCCVLVGPDTEPKLSNWSPGETPGDSFLNVSDKGWLAKWGVIRTKSDFSGLTDPLGTDAHGNVISVCPGFSTDITKMLLGVFCGIASFFHEMAISVMCFAQKQLMQSLGLLGTDTPMTTLEVTCKDNSDKTLPKYLSPGG